MKTTKKFLSIFSAIVILSSCGGIVTTGSHSSISEVSSTHATSSNNEQSHSEVSNPTSTENNNSNQESIGQSQSTNTNSSSVNKPSSSVNDSKPTSSHDTPVSSSNSGHVSSEINKPSSSSKNDTVVDQKFTSYGKYGESVYATFNDSNASGCKVEYKLSSASSYSALDKELVRSVNSSTVRFDALGLKAGKYDFKVTTSSSQILEMKSITVTSYDRSGYAHFNYSKGVGAYNDDGTLKAGAKVYYVTEATKNSVGGKGFVNLLTGASGPTVIRFIGKIKCPQYLSANKLDTSITDIKGIIRKNQGNDSYWNMIDVSSKSNITIEGVGDDAEIFQFGFTFKKCQSIEVRNLTFTDYPEDACSFEGDAKSASSCAGYSNYWIHNNVFNIGKNGWDLTSEQDKHEGDGASDIKGVSNVTWSYNRFNNCHKTSLIGGADEHYQKNVTAHHNFYNKTASRTPLGRKANMHYYNNYYNACGSYCVSLRANSYMFSEANYVQGGKIFRENKPGGACKSFNDVFSGSKTGDINKVTDRTKTVSNNNEFNKTFDTDSKAFYYDATNKVSKVSYLTSAEQAKQDCTNYAGVAKINPSNNMVEDDPVISSSSSSNTSSSSSKPVVSSSNNTSSSSSSIVIPSGEKAILNAADLEKQELTSDLSTGLFTIKATSAKKVTIASSDSFKDLDASYTSIIKLGGGGTKDYRSIKFSLARNATVQIFGASSSTSTARTFLINDSSTDTTVFQQSVDVPTEIRATLSSGEYYVCSKSSGFNIAAIIITYNK